MKKRTVSRRVGLFDKFRKRISVSNESGVFRIIEKTGFPEKYIPPEGKEKLNVIVPKEVRIIGNRPRSLSTK